MTTLEDFTFDYLSQSMLARVPNTVDKREGSIIYDTITPTARELATYYTNLIEIKKQAYALTATGSFLDLIVAEAGISRQTATYAHKLVSFTDDNDNPIAVAVGSRFSTIVTDTPINYYVSAPYTDTNGNVVAGSYIAICELAGTNGNGYTGNILPITFLNGYKTAVMTETLIPAEDEEDDETLRARFFDKISQMAFGGNIAQYKEYINSISGISVGQIYPCWNGGGTVKLSILDSSYQTCSVDFLNTVQNTIDPLAINGVPTTGAGLGIAPIDHKVTVVTPTECPISFNAKIVLSSGYSLQSVINTVTTAIQNYILNVKKGWATGNELNQYFANIYWAKVSAVIMSCDGVANITTLTINGGTTDLILTQCGALQQIPKMGTVTITT